jgi:hypothetical protein
VGPRAILDVVVKRKIPSPCWESKLRNPIVQLVARRYKKKKRSHRSTDIRRIRGY